MINEKMKTLGCNRSTIRELFEFGKKLKAEIGEENVFDFSLGNPSVEPPSELSKEIISLVETENATVLHGYTSAEGDLGVRTVISDYITSTFGAKCSPNLIYMTAGAAAALTSTLGAITAPGENVIVLAPYFPEYKVFIERSGALVKEVESGNDFRPDFEKLDAAIDERTAAVIINSPNNPTGVVYSEDDIRNLADLLNKKSEEYGKPIYLISDEPYRELVYDGISVPYVPNYYNNTVVCYSFSKSLSIPGDRIGYVFVSPKADDAEAVFSAVCGAGRALGYVCAPSLLQRLVAKLIGKTSDISIYEKNRSILHSALTKYGYEVIYPSGAFYLFVKAPGGDAKKFSQAAKSFGLLLVPSDDFGCGGYVRLAYCQSPDMIERSVPIFEKLLKNFI